MRRELVVGGVLAVAVLLGVLLYGRRPEPLETPPGDAGRSTAAAKDLVVPGPAAPPESPGTELASARSDLESARKRIAELEQKIRDAEAEQAKLKAALDQQVGFRGATVAQILGAFDKLKRKGIGAFLAPGARAQLVSDLKGLGDEGVDLVTGMLGSEDKDTRFLAAALLEDLADPRSVGALRETALKDSEEMVANMASHALALLDHPSALDPLRELVANSQRDGVKVNSMYGLVKHGDARGIEIALEYLRNDSNPVQLQAALAPGIFLLTDPRTMPLADACVSRFADHERLMTMAVNYFSTLGTPEARARLQAMSANTAHPEGVRNAAMQALAR